MDIEKLIEQLKDLEACAFGYQINGEVLGMDCSDFEQVMVDAADALEELQAENEYLRAVADGMRSNWYKSVENVKKLRAELEQVKQENSRLKED